MSTIQLQVALDLTDTATALAITKKTGAVVDIVEAGTVLCLAKGLDAVAELKSIIDHQELLADIRIARAGAKFAQMAFDAGADRVSLVGECDIGVIEDAATLAEEYGTRIEVELFPGWTNEQVKAFIDLDVASLIVHRYTCDAKENENVKKQLSRLAKLTENTGTKITLAGGLNSNSLPIFANCPFDIAVIGSAITKATDPLEEATAIKNLLLSFNH